MRLAAPLLTPPSPPSLLTALTRLWPLGRQSLGSSLSEPPKDPLLLTGQQLREAREAMGLGLRELAQQTRISTAVLEALERGWRDRLPEPAYLRTMLPLLEARLQLTPGSLQAALPAASKTAAGQRDSLRQRFTPGSIEVFTSWQGTLLYGLLGLSLVYGLNLSQRRLIDRGLQSIGPMPLSATPTTLEATVQGLSQGVYEDVLPLRSAANGRALKQWRKEVHNSEVDLSMGWLSLRLNEPTRLELKDSEGRRTSLEGANGEITLPVLPPFELNLSPPAPALSVRWNGRSLNTDPSEAGRYRYPPVATPQAPNASNSKGPKAAKEASVQDPPLPPDDSAPRVDRP